MRKKKTWALLLAFVLAVAAFPATALAVDAALTVKTPDKLPEAGETFTVTVELSGNPGFSAVQFTLAYDKSELECLDVTPGELFKGVLAVANPNGNRGAIVAAASTDTITKNGELATCTFQAKRALTAYDFSIVDALLNDIEGNTIFQTEEPETPAPTPTTPTTPTKPTPATPSSGSGTSGASGGGASGSTAVQTPAAADKQETAAAVPTFEDVSESFWGASWIAKAAQRGLFRGYDGKFFPNDPIKRCDFVLVLYRMAGEPEVAETSSFADVPSDAYYAKAVAWAYQKGLVNGKGYGFAPSDRLTRQEAVKVLFAYAGGQSGGELHVGQVYDETFPDSGEIAGWAKAPMYWAIYHGIINGMDGRLNPNGNTTRAQMSKILVEYQDRVDKEESA